MKRLFALLLLMFALLCGCAAKPAAPSSAPTPTPPPEPENAALYRQLALYIRQGLVDYKKPGAYTLSFGPVDYLDTCEVKVARSDGSFAVGNYSISYDPTRDWYAITSQDEIFLSEDGDFEVGGYEPEEILYTRTIDTETQPEELPRFDAPPVPAETTLWRNFTPLELEGSQFHTETYQYIDGRLEMNLLVDFPQLHPYDATESELALNALLADAAIGRREDYLSANGTVDVSYQITREDEEILSVRFYTYINYRRAAHPSDWNWGVTVDRETGKRLSLYDVLDWDGDGDALLKNYNWTSGGVYELFDLQQAGLYNDYDGHIDDFYLTDDTLGLVVNYGRYSYMVETPLKNLPLKRPV